MCEGKREREGTREGIGGEKRRGVKVGKEKRLDKGGGGECDFNLGWFNCILTSLHYFSSCSPETHTVPDIPLRYSLH